MSHRALPSRLAGRLVSVNRLMCWLDAETRQSSEERVAETSISFDAEIFAPPTLADLELGRQVQVTFTSPVRESYPVQAVAAQIIILR